MSSLPTPVNSQKPSRLPTSAVKAQKKRSREVVDADQGVGDPQLDAKKQKTMPTVARGKSQISRADTGTAKVARPLPNSMTTGRTTTFGRSGARTNASTVGNTNRAAMNDRTNVDRPSARANTGSKSSKRPAWDLKGRLEDMEAQFLATNARVATLESQNSVLKSNVEEKEEVVEQNSHELMNVKSENESLQKQIADLKREVTEANADKEEEVKKLKRQVDDLEFSKSSLERKVRSLEDELTSKMQEISGLKTSLAQVTSGAAGLEMELKTTKTLLTQAQTENANLKKDVSEKAAKIDDYEEMERKFETERRRLHNTIQELKGNIRVFCRIRPLLSDEVSNGNSEIKHIDFVDENSLALIRVAESPNESSIAGGLKGKSGRYDFQFDRVFGPKSGQSQVFEEISQLVQSAIDGYNVCVFAYGQTGSGKTFTMEGGESEAEDEQAGMIPRTIEKIFEETQRLMDKGWSYKLETSFLEIYNEEIRDLLANEKSSLKCEIKMSKENDGCAVVTNLQIEEVTSPEQIALLLRRARKNRAVAATNCNERSSRSHSVFQLKISGNNSITTESCSGMLNLVDLAGSERLKESGSEGVRLTETKSINKSLANLGNVIMALAQKDSYVPFRNSKLTHLLQGSLGGNSKTLMFVNISPKEDNFGETLNSLRFATKVNQCQIGTATKKVK